MRSALNQRERGREAQGQITEIRKQWRRNRKGGDRPTSPNVWSSDCPAHERARLCRGRTSGDEVFGFGIHDLSEARGRGSRLVSWLDGGSGVDKSDGRGSCCVLTIGSTNTIPSHIASPPFEILPLSSSARKNVVAVKLCPTLTTPGRVAGSSLLSRISGRSPGLGSSGR